MDVHEPEDYGGRAGDKKKISDRESSDGGKTASTSVNLPLPTSPYIKDIAIILNIQIKHLSRGI